MESRLVSGLRVERGGVGWAAEVEGKVGERRVGGGEGCGGLRVVSGGA